MQPKDSDLANAGSRDSLSTLFRNRNFGFYVGVRVATMLGQTIQGAAVMWQVYELSGSAMALALVGICRFAPQLAISFVAGAIVDTRDRRAILALSQIAPLGSSALLCALTATGAVTLMPIYIAVALVGLTSAFEAPARQSILPLVVPHESFQRAVSVGTIAQQLASVIGPAFAGLAIAQSGVAPAYAFHVALLLGGLVCLALIRVSADDSVGGTVSLAMIKEGLVYIWANPPVLGAMALDMFAVIFAGADALLPIYANDILGVGPFGYGLLTSAKAVGSLLTALAMALLPPVVHTGRALVVTVALYGLATMAFALSTWFPLSLVLYGLTAAFDQVSVVMRQSIIQLSTPNELRGRVSSVNGVFVGASNQLGGARAGFVASVTGSAVFAVAIGGVGCLAAVGAIAFFIPSLWRHRFDDKPTVRAAAS